jgi:heme exporter protein A
MLKLQVQALSRRYGFRKVFSGLNFEISSPGSIVVCGPNGSGKSTLLKLLSFLEIPSSGRIIYSSDTEVPIKKEKLRQKLSFVSPEFNLYEELTALENLRFFLSVSGRKFKRKDCLDVLDRVGLKQRIDDNVGEYSFGMKMRLKYALALAMESEIMVVDEPTTNLDRDGREIVYDIMRDHRTHGLLLYATNEESETKLGDLRIELGD